ncbi:MAG: hypothetical protein IJD25_03030 [Alphaproteobacteria bacterium]|nr:hypothetical protein [Alphaproteobacteria bacterium]
MTTAETTTTQTPETVQPQTPAPTDQETKQQEQPKPIPSPIEQVFLENQEEFQAAGLTAKALSVQAPEGAQLAGKEALEALPEEKREAVQKAMAEGYFITVDGQTFSPPKEGVERREKRETLTQAALDGGRDQLVAAGLWDKETNMPSSNALDRMHVKTNDNADISSNDEEDRKAEALLSGYRVEGDWWERNKDWLIPLLLALAGTALGFALSHLFDSKDGSGHTIANNLIDKATTTENKEQSQTENKEQSQEGGNNNQGQEGGNNGQNQEGTSPQSPNVSGALEGAGQQLPTENPGQSNNPRKPVNLGGYGNGLN